MGNCNHCCVGELLPNRPLNKSISLHVHVGSGFIEHKNPVSPNEGPRKTEQLLLTHRETLGRVGDISLQLVGKLNKGTVTLWTWALRPDSSRTRHIYVSFDCSKGSMFCLTDPLKRKGVWGITEMCFLKECSPIFSASQPPTLRTDPSSGSTSLNNT